MGLEVVVRPSVFPNIRPRTTQPAATEDPEARQTKLTGGNGLVLDLSYSSTSSQSKQRNREVQRTFDIARVYQVRDDGSINPANFVDVEIPHKIVTEASERGPRTKYQFRQPQESDYPHGNIEILERNLVRRNPRE